MRLPAFLGIVAAPLVVLAAACVDGATPDCTTPNSGCFVAATDAATEAGDASTSDAHATDAAADAATDDAPDDAAKADAGDAKTD